MRSPADCDAGAPGNFSHTTLFASLSGPDLQSVVTQRKVFAKNWIN
jgi:hypothetical protein